MKRGIIAIATCALLTGLVHESLACSVCTGAPQAPLTKGLNMGVGVLLAVTVSVLLGFVLFITHLARCARAASAGNNSSATNHGGASC